METGQINAVLSSGDGGAARKLWDRLKNFSEIGYAIRSASPPSTSMRIPPGCRDPRRGRCGGGRDQRTPWQAMRGGWSRTTRGMREQGMQIASPAPAPVIDMLRDAGTAALGDWQKRAGAAGQKILDAYWRRQR